MITKKLSTGKCKLIFVAKIQKMNLIHWLWKKLCKLYTGTGQILKSFPQFWINMCISRGKVNKKEET